MKFVDLVTSAVTLRVPINFTFFLGAYVEFSVFCFPDAQHPVKNVVPQCFSGFKNGIPRKGHKMFTQIEKRWPCSSTETPEI